MSGTGVLEAIRGIAPAVYPFLQAFLLGSADPIASGPSGRYGGRHASGVLSPNINQYKAVF